MIDHDNLGFGLWCNPYMKVYSLVGDERVMELSTSPRAYKDIGPHIYGVDTPFIVTEADFNDWGGEIASFYQDPYDNIFYLGEQAIHYWWEPLPGSFPLWIESEELPDPFYDKKLHTFPILKEIVLGQLVDIIILEADLYESGNWLPIPQEQVDTVWSQLSFGEIKIPRKGQQPQRFLIRIKYSRCFGK